MRRLSWVTLLGLVGCSSSPYAPINQVTPIKQMDAFFAYWNTPQYPAGYHPAPETHRLATLQVTRCSYASPPNLEGRPTVRSFQADRPVVLTGSRLFPFKTLFQKRAERQSGYA
jgi:hypothetical protein